MSENVDGIRKIAGGATAARGFEAASTAAGIKHRDGKDMILIHGGTPCKSADTSTSNVVGAVPVKWDRSQATGNTPARTVVINAGVVNACTGEEGMGYCSQVANAAAVALGVPIKSVLVAPTGVIGKQLPMDKIKTDIEATAPLLDDGTDSGTKASKAITITDTKNGEVAVQFELGGVTVIMGRICKGSGMIHPDMCTILSFVTTNATVSKEMLREALSEDIKDTYNMISMDGDISTNDTVLLLTNGLTGNEEIREENNDYQVFCKVLSYISEILTKRMAGGSEGCMALFEMTIVGAKIKDQAKVLARSVVASSLTKVAIFGHDTNWGRILCAMGYSGVSFDPEKVGLFFKSAAGEMQIIKDGIAVDYNEGQATKIPFQPRVTTVADIEMGDAQATVWGCDLTLDYVKINADYRS